MAQRSAAVIAVVMTQTFLRSAARGFPASPPSHKE